MTEAVKRVESLEKIAYDIFGAVGIAEINESEEKVVIRFYKAQNGQKLNEFSKKIGASRFEEVSVSRMLGNGKEERREQFFIVTFYKKEK